MGALSADSSWRMNTAQLERPTYRSTLEMEVAETKQMLSQQQLALSSLTEMLKSIQTEIGKKNDASSDVVDAANRARPTSGDDVNKAKTKVKPIERRISTFFAEDTDSESDESDEDCEDDEEIVEPPSKQAKFDAAEAGNGSNNTQSRLSKLDNLFKDKSEQGPKVNENLAKTVNRGISYNFSIKSALEFGDNYKTPENCEFLRVPKLNEELFFEESIATRYKKNDGMLQKTTVVDQRYDSSCSVDE